MSRPLKLTLIIGGSIIAGMILMFAVAIGLGWYWTDGPGAQPSVAQQQQEWEQELEQDACESIKQLSPGLLETRWAISDIRTDGLTVDRVKAYTNAGDRSQSYNCHDQAWQRYLKERVESYFEQSPAWEAGETFATWYGP